VRGSARTGPTVLQVPAEMTGTMRPTVLDFPPSCGLAANTSFTWRDLMLQNPSPLSRALSLL
jgi:hypothetical protein